MSTPAPFTGGLNSTLARNGQCIISEHVPERRDSEERRTFEQYRNSLVMRLSQQPKFYVNVGKEEVAQVARYTSISHVKSARRVAGIPEALRNRDQRNDHEPFLKDFARVTARAREYGMQKSVC
jgi:hypothetical protein